MSEEKIEIKEAYIASESYPILWVGENGYHIKRYGKLIKVKPSKDEEEMTLIVPTLKLFEKQMPFVPDKLYIVAGGISQKLAYVIDVIEVYRKEIKKITLSELGFPANVKCELASGIKEKTWGIIYTSDFSINLFEPLEIPEGRSVIGKIYPETFKIFKQNGKLFIKYIQPEDC